MKTLHVSDLLDSGGAEAVFRDTVRASRELGHDVATLVSDGRRTPLSYLWSVRWQNELLRMLRSYRPDVVHIHNYYRFLSPSILFALRRHRSAGAEFRVIFTAHDYHLICPNSGLQHFPGGKRRNLEPLAHRVPLAARYDERSVVHGILKSMQRMIAYRLLRLESVIDLILAPSETLRDAFVAHGITVPILVLRNPVHQIRAKRTPSGTRRLVYMGRVAPEKGIIEFVRDIDGAVPDVELAVFGSGTEIRGLTEMSSSLRTVRLVLNEPVPRRELPRVLEGFDALIYPSRWIENAPIVVIEAITAGLSCIVPSGGGAQEMASEGRYSFTYDAADRESLRAAVEAALGLSAVNELRAPEIFSLENYRRRIGEIYGADDGERL